jgi:hypothetical protein
MTNSTKTTGEDNMTNISRTTPSSGYTFDGQNVVQVWFKEPRVYTYTPTSPRFNEHVARIVTKPTSGGIVAVHDTEKSMTMFDSKAQTVTRVSKDGSFRAVYTPGCKNYRYLAGLVARKGFLKSK